MIVPGRNWLAVPESLAWVIGGLASAVIAATMVYAAWLGASVSELKTEVAKLNVKVDYLKPEV